MNWYIGGNSIAELPTAVAGVTPGVYLVYATWYAPTVGPPGMHYITAGITMLRWLGTTSDFLEMAQASRKKLGMEKCDCLLNMLTRNRVSQTDGGVPWEVRSRGTVQLDGRRRMVACSWKDYDAAKKL